jgi:5-methylcytosine-specific restriction endonuclease McrA
MPIRPENQPLYPPNWRAIAITIRQDRAGERRERCGVPNGVWRNHRTEAWTHDAGLAEAWRLDGDRIVLTVAHLDHDPRHNDPSNLKALCQRCHNRHDAPHRRRTAYATRHHGKATGDFFDIPNTQAQPRASHR